MRDERVLKLIERFLLAGLVSDNQWQATERGAQQGAIISPLLANIYLHTLDTFIESGYVASMPSPVGYVRYADDFVVLTRNKQDAEMIRFALQAFLASTLELNLSETKTKLSHLKRGIRFLGFDIQSRRNLFGQQINVRIPKDLAKQLQARIAEILGSDKPIKAKLMFLNRFLNSWGHSYYRCDNALRIFKQLDASLREQVLKHLARLQNLSLAKARRMFLNKGVITLEGLELRQLRAIVERNEMKALPEALELQGA